MVRITERDEDRSRIIQYDNPPRGYMTGEGATALADAVRRAASDDSVGVIILTGTGEVFVRHYDVAEIVAAGEALEAGAITTENFQAGPFVDLLDAVTDAPKPVIAAINGTCMGGGFELALACDIRVASESVAEIGLPETRIGIFPGGGGTQRLPRLIGEAAALDFILRGTVVDAEDAWALGLVHEFGGDALADALEIAAEMAARGAEGLAAAKRLVRGAADRPLAEGLAMERAGFADVLRSQSAMTAMRDFLDGDGDITA